MVNVKFDKVELYEVSVVETFTRDFCIGRDVAEKNKKYLEEILPGHTIEINHLTSQVVTGIEGV